MTDLWMLALPTAAGIVVVVALLYIRRRWGAGSDHDSDGGWTDGGSDGGGDGGGGD